MENQEKKKDPLKELNILKQDVLDNRIKDPIQLRVRCKQVWDSLHDEQSDTVLNQALTSLNRLIGSGKINPYFRAIIATTAGAIIETGKVDPMIIFENTFNLFMTAIRLGQDILKVKEQDPHPKISKIDPELQKKYPDATLAWAVLDVLSEPMKSLLIMSKKARQSIKDNDNYSAITNSILTYSYYHEGCYWVYTAINIMDGDILIFHPQSFRGFKIRVTDMIDPMILSYLCTKNLTGDPNEGFIPKQSNVGASQFGLFNWKLINYLYKEGTEPGSNSWSKSGVELMKNNNAYIGSGTNMSDVLVFNNEIPILFLVDYGKPLNFEIHELGLVKPKAELVEKLDRSDVEKWLNKIKLHS